MSDNSSLKIAGEVDLQKIELFTYKNEAIDIRHQMVSISLYEDLFSQAVHGTVTVTDSLGLIENMPLIGEEKIRIKYQTPTMDDHVVDYVGYVYKVGDCLEFSDRGRTYTIYFTSFEAIIDANKKISKYFGGKVSDTVQAVCFDKTMLGSDKKIIVEDTGNLMKFVSPYWSPYQIIGYCASTALTQDQKAANYLFYETLRGDLNFVSMNSKFNKNNKAKVDYVYNQDTVRERTANGTVRDLDKAYSRILEFSMDTAFDYIKRTTSGVYGNRLITANTVSKTIKVTSNDYLKDFGKTNHLAEFPIISTDAYRSKNARLVHHVNPEYNFGGQRNTRFHEWMLQRQSLLSQLDNTMKIDVTVLGRTDMHAGDVVTLSIPTVQSVNEGESTDDNVNKYYSGRYLISAIHHRIEGRSHMMTMQCVTDALSKEL